MNAELIIQDAVSALQKRFGKGRRLGKSRILAFSSAVCCSINYSKLLGGHRYFFGMPKDVVDPNYAFPDTSQGDFVALVCGSADQILFLPRGLVVEALIDVPSRRIDILCEDGRYVMQTTRHPKLDVTGFLNTFPSIQPPRADPLEPELAQLPDRTHVRIQWALIHLGTAEGCSVWIPPTDQNLSYEGERLNRLTIDRLPSFGFEENTRRIVENIDVLWLSAKVIRKAFEIESTTSIYSGLLRLNDLILAQPNNRIDLYLAAASSRRERVRSQLLRPTFEPLLERCEFLAFEDIMTEFDRLRTLPVEAGARVSGLIRGERFSRPEHYIYPQV